MTLFSTSTPFAALHPALAGAALAPNRAALVSSATEIPFPSLGQGAAASLHVSHYSPYHSVDDMTHAFVSALCASAEHLP